MLYHPETDDFELIKIEGKEGRHVTNIMELHNGEVWGITTGDTIFRINLTQKGIEPIDEINRKLHLKSFSSIYEDTRRNLWFISETQGLLCFNQNLKRYNTSNIPIFQITTYRPSKKIKTEISLSEH